jgi:hypothetical protein
MTGISYKPVALGEYVADLPRASTVSDMRFNCIEWRQMSLSDASTPWKRSPNSGWLLLILWIGGCAI